MLLKLLKQLASMLALPTSSTSDTSVQTEELQGGDGHTPLGTVRACVCVCVCVCVVTALLPASQLQALEDSFAQQAAAVSIHHQQCVEERMATFQQQCEARSKRQLEVEVRKREREKFL